MPRALQPAWAEGEPGSQRANDERSRCRSRAWRSGAPPGWRPGPASGWPGADDRERTARRRGTARDAAGCATSWPMGGEHVQADHDRTPKRSQPSSVRAWASVPAGTAGALVEEGAGEGRGQGAHNGGVIRSRGGRPSVLPVPLSRHWVTPAGADWAAKGRLTLGRDRSKRSTIGGSCTQNDQLDAAREVGADSGPAPSRSRPERPSPHVDFLAKEGVTPPPSRSSRRRAPRPASARGRPTPPGGHRGFRAAALHQPGGLPARLRVAFFSTSPRTERVAAASSRGSSWRSSADLLDEFFQGRVRGLEDQVAARRAHASPPTGCGPGEQLRAHRNRVSELTARQTAFFLDHLVPSLARPGCGSRTGPRSTRDDRAYLVDIFDIRCSGAHPAGGRPGHPFPYISNLSLNLVVEVMDP